MIRLNLPAFDYQLSDEGNKVRIFDIIRKKFVALTPEEWVRQHFLHFLIRHKNYPKALIRIEGGLTYNKLLRRTDIIVFDRQAKPWMIIECKRPDQEITTRVLEQVSVYNAVHRAPYLAVTNGMKHYYFETNWSLGTSQSMKDIPEYKVGP